MCVGSWDMSKNILSDDRNKPKWTNAEGTELPQAWQEHMNNKRYEVDPIPPFRKCLSCDEPAATYIHPDNVLCMSCRESWEQ